jgi:hypothetical protein
MSRPTPNPLRITERQRAVLETTRLKLNTVQSLAYLRSQGFDVSDKTLWREKKHLQDSSLSRIYHIGQTFPEKHLETVDEYEMGFKMMWQNVMRMRDNPYKQNLMIKDIMMLKPYLSAYYEATKLVIEKRNPSSSSSSSSSSSQDNNSDNKKDLLLLPITNKIEQKLEEIDPQDNDISTYRGNREEIGLSEAEREYRKQKEQRIF